MIEQLLAWSPFKWEITLGEFLGLVIGWYYAQKIAEKVAGSRAQLDLIGELCSDVRSQLRQLSQLVRENSVDAIIRVHPQVQATSNAIYVLQQLAEKKFPKQHGFKTIDDMWGHIRAEVTDPLTTAPPRYGPKDIRRIEGEITKLTLLLVELEHRVNG